MQQFQYNYLMTNVQWQSLRDDFQTVGEGLLKRQNQGEVAIFATVGADGKPALSPVCPIFSQPGIYVLLSRNTPKLRHLESDQRYSMHAQVGADDLEFQISGRCRFVVGAEERSAVFNNIQYASVDREDVLVELLIERALYVTWQDGHPTKQRWHST